MEAKRNEEIKKSNGIIADLSKPIHRLGAKFTGTKFKKYEELKQMMEENSGIVSELTHCKYRW